MTPNRATTLHDYHERLNRVLLHIDRHRGEELTLERLAAVACLSPCHFHRIFRAMVGEPLGQHVQRVRLEAAVVPLQTSTRSVLEIALDSGYESAAAFARAFEQRFGVPPSACRRARRIELQARTARFIQPANTMIAPEIRQRPACPVAYVRHIGPYAGVGAAWEQLCGFAGPRGLLGPHTEYLGLSRDDPKITAADRLRYDACITLDRPLDPAGPVGVQTVPGGRYAVFLHRGPHENLSATYDRIFGDWLPRAGERLRDDPGFERYLNTPAQVAPAELRTEIWLPLA